MKFLSIVGARPQFIKASLLSKELRKRHREILVHTGQHYDFSMSDKFFQELAIPKPKVNLNIGSGSQGYQIGKMIMGLEEVLLKEKPDTVIVYGDTNSTAAGAIAASKLKIPVAHVEAGLREFDKTIPEEINKLITDHLSTYLFAPTRTAIENLRKEGITKGVFLVGDIAIALLKQVARVVGDKKAILKKFGVLPQKYYLLTVHREKNTDNYRNLKNIMQAVAKLDYPVIFPMHPRTKKYIKQFSLDWVFSHSNLIITEPLGYYDIIALIKNAKLVLTDSGGVIKESYFLKRPCSTVDVTTEWIETIEDGWNKITGPHKETILKAVKDGHKIIRHRRYLFGKGNTHKLICKILESHKYG
jgi:UDP-N-acetylglucosamine 2-epimerase (non-hydrolysing)